jgi:hypothetical protein
MLSNGGKFGSSWLRRCSLAIIIGSGVWCRSANALAQDAHPTGLRITAHLTSRSPEGPGFEKAPYLVVGMVDAPPGTTFHWRRAETKPRVHLKKLR